MATRKEQAEISKAKIINAARDLIKEKGYDDIHITEITAKCQMTVGNFYNYFKSKEQLFLEIDDVNFYGTFLSLKAEQDLPVVDRLSLYVQEWFYIMLEHYGANYMQHWAQRYSKKLTGQDGNDKIDFIANHVANMLDIGIQKGQLSEDTPVNIIAYSIAFAIFGCGTHYGVNGDERFVKSWVCQFCDIFIKNSVERYLVQQKE